MFSKKALGHFFKKWQRNEKIMLGALLVSGILAVTPLRLISFGIIILVLAILIPLGKHGIITRLVVGFITIASLNGLIAIVFWLIHKPLSSGILLIGYALPLMAWLILRKQRGAKIDKVRFDLHDFLAIAVSIATITLLCWPLFFGDVLGPSIARLVMAGGDNSAHIEMVKTNDLNRGVAYGFERNRVQPSPGTSNYPQMWHFNVAFTKWLVEPQMQNPNSASRILFIYYMNAALWFGLLIFSIVRLSLFLGEQISGKRDRLAALGTIITIIPFATHWLVDLFSNGFHAQNTALLLIIIEALLLIEAFKRPPKERFSLLLLATLCTASVTYAWIFLVPIGAVPLGISLIATWWHNNKKIPLYYLLCTIILGLLAGVQFYLYKLYPLRFETPWILQRGYITHTAMYTLIFLLGIAALYTYMFWRTKALRMVFTFLACSFIFSLWLFNYQLSHVGELRYFYFKSTYTVIIFASIIVGAAVYHALSIFSKQKISKATIRNKIVLVVGMIFVSSMVVWATRHPVLDKYADSTLGGITQGQASEIITQLAIHQSDNIKLGFIGACNRGDDIRASQLAHALTYVTRDTSVPSIYLDASPHDENKLFFYVADVAARDQRQIIIVSSDQVISNKLMAYLEQRQLKSRVKLIDIDTTLETEPLQQCPDRVRDLQAFPLS